MRAAGAKVACSIHDVVAVKWDRIRRFLTHIPRFTLHLGHPAHRHRFGAMMVVAVIRNVLSTRDAHGARQQVHRAPHTQTSAVENMRVYHRRLHVPMTQQLLNGAYVIPCL